jgi:hypothetical protein
MHSSPLARAYSRMRTFSLLSSLLALLILAGPCRLAATDWSTLFTAQDVRDHLSTTEGREQALAFCRRMGLSKVYVEAFRGPYQADAATLKAARDFFRQAGLKVSGCVTTTRFGKPTTGWEVGACYTNRANQEHLASIFRFTAELFDEIMIDDFFFTDCECSECSAARGSMSWPQYREKLMLQVSRDCVLGPARKANPNVKVILKYPQWYDNFHNRGYVVDKETELYDRIWVGTETRDYTNQRWGGKVQYEGYYIMRWLGEIGGPKTGGGWFDPYGTNPTIYLDQAYVSVLAGAPEIVLFHYGSLVSPQYQAQAETFAAHRSELESLAKLVGNFQGIASYKPPSSDPGDESYIFDQIGMLAIPLTPTARFPKGARAALFTEHALHDAGLVPELTEFLDAGGTALISSGLGRRLDADPRLPTKESLKLKEGEGLRTVKAGAGRLVIFSDDLPGLTYVDSQNKVRQPTPELNKALGELRQVVSGFTVTSLDAPPRIAVFPMGGRVVVVNFTELPVACAIKGLEGMARKYKTAFATQGASLDKDGTTLHLPAHGLLVVE